MTAARVTLAAVLAVTLTGCTPVDGGRCTTPGAYQTDPDGNRLQCYTDDGDRTPRWHEVTR